MYDEKAIFEVAFQIDDVDLRERYLSQVCADDIPLRRRVGKLLQMQADEPGFLEASPVSAFQDVFPTDAHPPGSKIGPYTLREQIGEGGMGVVYVADQTDPVKRTVALKIIKPGMATKDVVARFQAERQALALMDHPHIAQVHHAGATESGLPFFVMELVRGVPITEFCDERQFTTGQRLQLFVDVCQAIQHAHQKGVIHRDIKPSNVLVTLHDDKPVAKVIDFGVAKAIDQELTQQTLYTQFAQMIGTPLYMSPEQAEMNALDVDTRSDIYSLGVLLYELITGATPFDHESVNQAGFDELRRIIREVEPPRPSQRISTLDAHALSTASQRRGVDGRQLSRMLRGELDWIVMKALEKDRQRRYQTARGLAADVNRYLSGEPVEACPPTWGYRLSKFVNRYKSQVAVASLFLFLLVASSVLAWVLLVNTQRARNEAEWATDDAVAAKEEMQKQKELAEANLVRAQQQEKVVTSLADERQRRLYDYNLIKAGAAFRQNKAIKAARLLAECLEEQRGWEWHRLSRLIGAERTLQLCETPIAYWAVSPSRPQIVTIDATGNYRLCDLTTGEEIMSQATGIGQPRWSRFGPDGKLLALVSAGPIQTNQGRLEVWDAAAGTKVWDFTSKTDVFVFGSFSADGKHLVFGGINTATAEGTVYLVDLREPQPELTWKQPTPHHGTPAPVFAPDSRHICLTIATGILGTPKKASLRYWSMDGPTEIWFQPEITSSVPCVTPDGRQVITGGPNHSLEIRDASTGELLQELPGDLPDVVIGSKFSPDGRNFVSFGHSGHVLVRDGRSMRKLGTFTIPVMDTLKKASALPRVYHAPYFSPDGDRLVVQSPTAGAVDIREVHPPPAEFALMGHDKAVKGVNFSVDGKQVYSVSRDGTLRVWSSSTGQELRTIQAHSSASDLALAPQGNSIATGGSDGVKLWSADSGQLIRHWSETTDVWWIDFSPDGKRIVAEGGPLQGNTALLLFDVPSGRQLLSPETPIKLDGLVFCADSRRAVSVMWKSGQLDLWNLESGEAQTIREGPEGAITRCLVRSPQANIVAVVIGDTIELWDVERKQLQTTLQGDGQTPYCLAFNHDGSRLFSGDVGGTVKVWNLDTEEQLLSFKAHEVVGDSIEARAVGVLALAISPDGKTLATGGADGQVKLWETAYPSRAVAKKRQIVAAATRIVNQQYQRFGDQRAVLESLTQDNSLDRDVLATAVDIVSARGDRPLVPSSER